MIRAALGTALLAVSGVAAAQSPALYGVHEHVELSGLGVHLPAKLDTGAETASLSATGIELFKRDGQRWVRFRLTDNLDQHGHLIEKPLARMGYIKRRADDRAVGDEELYTQRPVIEMDVCVGSTRQTIEMNLTDRSAFEYPVLIGANALRSMNAAVDPSRRFSAGHPSCS
jgi:hypothetical protein